MTLQFMWPWTIHLMSQREIQLASFTSFHLPLPWSEWDQPCLHPWAGLKTCFTACGGWGHLPWPSHNQGSHCPLLLFRKWFYFQDINNNFFSDMNNDYAHGLESVWSSEWGPPSNPESQVQSQAHDQGVQLERHEEGDEGGGQKACKKLKLSFKPIQNSFHDSLMEMEYKLDVVHPLHHLPPGYQGPHHQVACLHLQTLLIMLFQDAQDGVGGPPCQLWQLHAGDVRGQTSHVLG